MKLIEGIFLRVKNALTQIHTLLFARLSMPHNVSPILFWKPITLYLIVSLFLFFEIAVQVSPAVMSNQLMHDLNINAFQLGLMSGFYFYSYTLMQIPSGLLLDKYNPRIIISASLVVCALGTLLFSIADGIYLASIARILMGLGSAFAFVSVLVVTADLFASKYFATITGITQMLAAFGAMTGQLPIAALEANIGWRNTMLVFAAVGIILALMVFRLLKYKRCRLSASQPSGNPSNTKHNLIQVISKKQNWYVAVYACLLWAPMAGFASLWGVPFLISADHLSQGSAAFICSFMWLGLALASPLLGAISTFTENKNILFSLIALVGAVSFYSVFANSFSVMTLALLLFFSGAACAGQALSFSLIKENNPDSIKATAIAFNNMAVVISGAIFQPLIGKIIDFGKIGSYSAVDYKRGLSVIFVSYIIAFLIPILLFKGHRKVQSEVINQDELFKQVA